ncbi:unnamed protein product, partial [Vitis vinifera]|uniref:Uncharacterized protein n=1 Tax=Vitis vinifera TaxID=29760 RepID=E0CUF2_VITVI
MQVPSVASTSTAGDDATEVIEARISETSKTMLRLALSLVRDVGALRCRPGGSEGNSSVPCPSPEHHTKDQPMWPTRVRQPLAEEIEPKDSLVPTPHSPVGMGPSPTPTYSEPLVPQSQAKASLPAEVTVVTEKCGFQRIDFPENIGKFVFFEIGIIWVLKIPRTEMGY